MRDSVLSSIIRSSSAPEVNGLALAVKSGERVALQGEATRCDLVLKRLSDQMITLGVDPQVPKDVTLIDDDIERVLNTEETGEENFARLTGIHAGLAGEMTDLGKLLDVPVRQCSPGMRWRLAFAATVVRAGEVVLIAPCLHRADLAFHWVMFDRLTHLIERSHAAVVAEPALFHLCDRAFEFIGDSLHQRPLQAPTRIAEAA